MDIPMSLTELIDSLSRILKIRMFTNDKRMINQIKSLKQFFNNEHGENFTFNDIRQYFEARKDMIQDIIAKKLQENKHFFHDDYHRLNYIIVCIKNDYIDKIIKAEEQKQKEFQEKVVKSTMSGISDDEFLAMIQEQDASDNLSESDSGFSESESEIQTNGSNDTKPENTNGGVKGDNKLDVKVESVKKEITDKFNERLAELEKGLSKQLLEIKCALPVEEVQSAEDKPKRRGRPRKSEKLMKCLNCGEDKRADELKKGIENDFYKSHSKIHSGCNGFIPICKECMENIYDNLESELAAAIKKAEIDVAEYYVEKKVIERLCMMNDIYYNDSLFDAALKHSSNNTMLSAYMRVANLIQYKKKTYEDSFKENLKQEFLGIKQEQEIDLSWMGDVV